MNSGAVCPVCGGEMVFYGILRAGLICPVCGYNVQVIDQAVAVETFDTAPYINRVVWRAVGRMQQFYNGYGDFEGVAIQARSMLASFVETTDADVFMQVFVLGAVANVIDAFEYNADGEHSFAYMLLEAMRVGIDDALVIGRAAAGGDDESGV